MNANLSEKHTVNKKLPMLRLNNVYVIPNICMKTPFPSHKEEHNAVEFPVTDRA
jgi:hypothetical protein